MTFSKPVSQSRIAIAAALGVATLAILASIKLNHRSAPDAAR
jgi:hypothetical protein